MSTTAALVRKLFGPPGTPAANALDLQEQAASVHAGLLEQACAHADAGLARSLAPLQTFVHDRAPRTVRRRLLCHPLFIEGLHSLAPVCPELRRWHDIGVRGLRFNHFFRGGSLHYRGGVPLRAASALAPMMADLGWHLQLWIDVKDLPDIVPLLRQIGLPVVVHHMGRTDAIAGTGSPGFQDLLRYLGNGACWVKLSGAHRVSQRSPGYEDARPFHEALVRTNPERLVWGSDWPHPRMEGEMPDAGLLFELFHAWTPDESTRQRILVANPARLYGFA